MGAWASGCEVTVVTGSVLVIEWVRGTNDWRSTYLAAGDRHTIQLVAPENNAMIETPNTIDDFSVSLENCSPQPLP
jgi:hypothetical protein